MFLYKNLKYRLRTIAGGAKLKHLFYDLRFWVRNARFFRYLSWCKSSVKKDVIYFVIDLRLKHPGLADRLKAIVNVYNIAKMNNYEFKIIYKSPFCLEKYLLPNEINWVADFNNLEYSLKDTRFFNEVNWHNNFILRKGKQYHCYNYTGNRLPRIFPESGYSWSMLYKELFKPCNEIRDAVNNTGLEEHKYISIHLRFVNALDNFEEGHYNGLKTESERIRLIDRCKKGILDICEKHPREKICVFSDSVTFLENIKELPVIVLDHSSVGHISFEHDKNTILKTFLDFYVISRSSVVYRICAPEMYSSSCFSLCAAVMGNCDFQNIDV